MPTMRALRRLLPYFRPYRWQVFLGLACVIVSAAFASVTPWLLRSALDGIGSGAPARRIWTLAASMVALALVAGVLRYGMRDLINGLSRRIEYDLRNDLFVHLLKLDAAYFGRTRTGDIMARLTNDLSAVRQAAGPAIMYLTNTVAGAAFALYFMLRIDVRLTLLALTPMVVLPVMTMWLGRAIHERFEAVQEHFSTMTTRAQENLAGARIVRAYRQEQAELDRFAALNEQYLDEEHGARSSVRDHEPRVWPARRTGRRDGAWRRRGARRQRYDLRRGLRRVRALPRHADLAAHRVRLGSEPVSARRGVHGSAGSRSSTRHPPWRIRRLRLPCPRRPLDDLSSSEASGSIIRLRATRATRWVLRDISFRVEAGSTLAVVGATGSGKSALLELLARVYDPQEGQVLVDGVPVQSLTLDQLRREIGFVPQESLLFSETIRENLTYGTDDTAAAEWAAGVAQLDTTIENFPGGYDTLLGERGINLSGGQKQRAALARALARRPSIVVLDDALSAVDTHTEADILRGLREALRGRTAIIASHRISAVRDASWIIVLDEGRIVEQGRHTDLIVAGGRYWTLLRRQQLEDAIEDESVTPQGVAAG